MAENKLLGMILAVALLPGAAFAETVALNPSHPDRYVVQKGDTLWDISGRFLAQPWQWPEIWEVNPQIANPHLIFPGDELYLVYRDGKPVLRLRRGGRPVVKLSPQVREIPLDRGAIPAIPLDAIRQFLARPKVVAADELERSPYIVSLGKEHLIGGQGFNVYARGGDLGAYQRYTVYRQGTVYRNPDDEDEILGYEALHIGDAQLERDGDPATLLLTQTNREVLAGDRLLPVAEDEIDMQFMPHAPSGDVEGRIVAVVDGVTQIGQYQIVVLNLGARDGIESGHVMSVHQRGALVTDRYVRDPDLDRIPREAHIELDPDKQGGVDGFTVAVDNVVTEIVKALTPGQRQEEVRLPEEHAGLVMVFRPYEHVSYALVMEASRAMHVGDTVRNP